jgi:hypothetical protein
LGRLMQVAPGPITLRPVIPLSITELPITHRGSHATPPCQAVNCGCHRIIQVAEETGAAPGPCLHNERPPLPAWRVASGDCRRRWADSPGFLPATCRAGGRRSPAPGPNGRSGAARPPLRTWRRRPSRGGRRRAARRAQQGAACQAQARDRCRPVDQRRKAAATPASTGMWRPVVCDRSPPTSANTAAATCSGRTSFLSSVRWA